MLDDYLAYFLRVAGIMSLWILLLSYPSYAGITKEDAIKACIGEAEGEPYVGKVAVLEALRNRGTIQGVYGIKSKRIRKASKQSWNDCAKAWEESATSNLVHGADHWEAVETFGKPKWTTSMEKSAKVGHHTFYREKVS